MLYHVIHLTTHELKTLTAAEILDMNYDADGRIVITSKDKTQYFLLAGKDILQ